MIGQWEKPFTPSTRLAEIGAKSRSRTNARTVALLLLQHAQKPILDLSPGLPPGDEIPLEIQTLVKSQYQTATTHITVPTPLEAL
jgi:hypothetical protein